MSFERNVFLRALECDDPVQLARFLDDVCPDGQFRSRVEKMLAFDPDASFLSEEEISDGVSECTQEEPAALLGSNIGRYTLRDVVGEGGFGVVYRAEQIAPIRRHVALKIIRLGMDTRQVIARFEAERQVLALMDHPNIAKVHDGGASETGRPYFVMELVEGLPITTFCDQHQLSPAYRLRLVTQVCRAVHHAHQKGIIHRDIKPSNVLVTLQDEEPVIKIIDFGIAKVMRPTSSANVALTRFQQLVGTPAYMSPEHLVEGQVDVDTRSDVYSIGVLLYELLTGTTPLSEETLQHSTFDEIGRLIREQPCLKPSSRIRSLGITSGSVANNRSTDLAQLKRYVSGELDWIVLKALEKGRSRRYDSAINLAADLDAFLNHDPIQAAPPSLIYRSRKYMQRRWKLVSLISAVFVLLLISSIFSTTSFLTASRHIERSRRLLYASHVNLSGAAIESGNIKQAETLLLNHEHSDLRSFPWELMWRQLHQYEVKLDHGTPVHSVVFADDGSTLISIGESGRVRVWNSVQSTESHFLSCDMSTAMSGAALGDLLAVGGRREGKWESEGAVELWNWRTGTRMGTLELGIELGCIVALQFIPNTETLLIASVDQLIAYDFRVNSIRWQIEPTSLGYHGTQTRALAVSTCGERVATSNSETGIVVLDAQSGEQIGDRFDVQSVRCLQFVDNGRYLAVGQLLPASLHSLRLINLDKQGLLPPFGIGRQG